MNYETAQLTLSAEANPEAILALLAGSGAKRYHLAQNGEYSAGAGGWTLDRIGGEPWYEQQWQALPGVTQCDWVRYQPLSRASRRDAALSAAPVWRTLMLRVRSEASSEDVAALERELLAMPRYMPGMQRWALSRVSISEAGWTHIWQQEFVDINALLGEYLLHPYHWAWVDRRFDPEFPEWTVETRLSHAYCPLAQSLLSAIE